MRKLMVRPYTYLIVVLFIIPLFILLRSPSYGAAASIVELTIEETTGLDRAQDPVTSGIPLPESLNIRSIDNLAIQDTTGKLIPAQFTVLARWNGTPQDATKAIKWVLVDFQADVSANQTTHYTLVSDHSPSGNLSVQDQVDKILVNTGKARFQISKTHFNLFDTVWLDTDNDDQIDDTVLSQSNQGGVILTDRNGKRFTSTQEPPEEIVIEQAGSIHAVVKIRGVLKAQDGEYFAPSMHNSTEYPRFNQPYPNSFVYYNCRIHFFSDKDFVKLSFTLENNGANGRSNPEQYFAPIQIVHFDSLNLVLKQGISSANIISQDASASLGASDTFSLYQDWHENLTDDRVETLEPTFAKGAYYITKKNGQQLSTGQTNSGWIDVHGENAGIGVAIRHFWQNFPNKVTASPLELKIGLWPEEGYYPYCQSGDFPDANYPYCDLGGRDAGVYLFDAGRHKTYEMLLRFYAGPQEQSQSVHHALSLEYPLMALAPPSWYAESKALGLIAPAGLTSPDPEINEAMQRYDRLQTSLVYESDSDNGLTILNTKTMDPPHWEFNRQSGFFGWMNFGDLHWSSDISSSLHYDWTYVMLLHYIRTGGRHFFDAGVEMARHRYDIDQYHGDRTDTQGSHKWINHYQFYESSGHADPTQHPTHPSRVVSRSHTWNGGLVLYYLLTGDRKAWEIAEEVGKGVFNMYGEHGIADASQPSCCNDETRKESWSILNLINLYRVNGDPIYLEMIKNIAKNRLLYREQLIGAGGYWGCDASSGACERQMEPFTCVEVGCGACAGTQWSTMYIYLVEPLINAHYETQDEDLKHLLIRMANYTKDQLLFGGDFDTSGNYRPLQTNYLWVEQDPDGSIRGIRGEPVKTLFFGDLFAYAYLLTDEPTYRDWARQSFRDATFYYTSYGDYIPPDSRAKISYIDGQFPNSHTKVHGWMGRMNQVYLYTEAKAALGDPDINQDGQIDSLDLQLAVNVGLGTEQTPVIVQRADINGDGQVDSSDLQGLVMRILGFTQ